ncbi:hypothetical protein SAMN04488105_107181 [Salipiger thiooxidans]|uniref:Uncharacterized protein n=1 Tax=Salipiger thiooxidans TaxID=282683 RepID=A0A1G7FMY0_9RHOB|nr:hypothetical protein SAMN04488105_107181 [Salipiger thiooxidans]
MPGYYLPDPCGAGADRGRSHGDPHTCHLRPERAEVAGPVKMLSAADDPKDVAGPDAYIVTQILPKCAPLS